MNISYNWLKQYININVPADKLAEILTSIGLEVGSINEVQSIKGGLVGLVVGKVLSCENHENSDHLHVTKVDIGNTEPLQIVCGAPNVAAGQKVIVATVGTKLYTDENEEFTIKRSKIRGVESFGMLCAEDEIGIGSDHSGIIVLPNETKVGTTAADYYKVENDTIFEIDITPNRADAISHYGIARDLAAYFASRDANIKLQKTDVSDFKVENTDFTVNVKVENPQACLRYSAVTISGVTVKESPQWIKNRLSSIGIRPINNIVDATNYVLHAMGQPMHAFDGDKIDGNQVIVKNLPEGTKFTTLDGEERSLHAEDLMICNAQKGMCIGGVFGGLDSGITEKTNKIFLESACFNPVCIRKTARAHGLNTDASFRYERGCDPNNTIYILKYAALLIQKIAGGSISSEIIDIYPQPIAPFAVYLSYKKTDNLIGKTIELEELKTIVEGLEIKIENEDENGLYLSIPTYRVDVKRDVDVIEDILRIYGYNRIPIGTEIKSSLSYSHKPDSNKLQNIISEQLTANGFNEIMNNSLTKTAYYENSNAFPFANCVKIMNPLGIDLSVMRQTLLFGGLESIAHNRNHKNNNLKFYEFGNCYQFNAENKKENETLSTYHEDLHLGIWICGNKATQSWVQKEEPVTFFDIKAHVYNILKRLGIEERKLVSGNYSDEVFSEALRIYSDKGDLLITLGSIHTKTLKSIDIDVEVFYAEINWTNLLKEIPKQEINYQEIAKFPAVKRDLALLIDKQTTFAEIEKIARETERKLLKNINLFDVYEGKNLPVGKKSYAVSFVIQDSEKTLKDSQIDNIMQKIIKNLTEKLNATLR